jgi:uncharacterized membrane protein
MVLLILGVLLFAGVHLVPVVAVGFRARLIERIGEPAYKGLFALDVLLGIVLMVFGWRGATASLVYTAPAWGARAALPLMFAALVLFAASGVPTNLKRFLRHPQLTGVATWAFAHLLANGDSRSLILFGGVGAWAILSMALLNRRDGEWSKPEPLPLSAEVKPAVGGIVLFAVLYFAHPYIAGLPVVWR